MSAAGRLRGRAPAWRVFLMLALGTTTLAASFPLSFRRGSTFRAPSPRRRPGARFTPPPPPVPTDGAILHVPPLGAARSGNIPFAGHLLLLPAGNWQTLVLARTRKPVSAQIEVFARIDAGVLKGVLLALGSDPVANQPSPFHVPQRCSEPNTIASWVAPEPFTKDSRIHECWRLATFNPLALAECGRLDGVLGRALLRLDEMGVKFPDRLMLPHTLRSERAGFVSTLFLPDTRSPDAAGVRPWLAWARRYGVTA